MSERKINVIKHYPLQYLLTHYDELSSSLLALRSLAHELGSDAEIISDALHRAVSENQFGCTEDGVKAIIWCMLLDSFGANSLLAEFDVLRNGDAIKFLLQDLVSGDLLCQLSFSESFGDPSDEVNGNV